ncbi:serine-rich adhesin for platelets-like [Anopheles funestus]|uniref:serine-rich adhesin for platelets-like n=1 Tax=Anopheles funestus TaxID=62324 RepID=UPI0020C71B16|nr:serine-rich adhesin for platelets-like [Anopheles funestus]
MDDFDSATYSIESEPEQKRVSLDDVILPTVRRSAIQIVSLSPRRQSKRPVPLTTVGADNSTMQVTKLVLKTPPGSPKRQPKTPGIIIKSIQTLAGPGLTGAGNLERESVVAKTNNVLTEKRNMPILASEDPASYRIIPILSPQNKDVKKEFEVRRSERERATNDFQDFLRESFKENKTPPSTPPPLSSVPASSSAIEIIRSSDKGSSDADSTSVISVNQLKSTGKTGIQMATKEEIITIKTQPAIPDAQLMLATQQAAADQYTLLIQTQKPPETIRPSNEMFTTESIKPSQGETTTRSSIIMHPPQVLNQESQIAVELAKPPVSNATRAKPSSKHVSGSAKTGVVEEAKKKEKSYDPAKAREFMKEQQAKRRLEKKEPPIGTDGSSVEKDLIKQRLETLRQSSQKLVTKNLQKARQRSVSCAPKEAPNMNRKIPTGKIKGPASAQCNDRTSSNRPSMGLRKFASTPTLRLIKKQKDPPELKPANAPKPTEIALPAKESSPTVSKPSSAGSRGSDARIGKDSSTGRSANPSSASSVSKASLKIGILRKPDNLTLDDIAQPSPLKESQAASIPPTTKPKVNAQLIVINADQDITEPAKEAEKELKLQVPDVMLVPTTASTLPVKQQHESLVAPVKDEEHSTPVIPQSLPIKNIPPWLKQSLRQPDPYPFILAVRKKLEAVQNVREENKPTNNQEQKIMPQMPSSRYSSYMNEIESVPFIRKKPTTDGQHAEVNVLNKRQFSTGHDEGSSIVTRISPYSSPNTTSEISSIKSDIALPLPPLLSSTKIEIPHEPYCPTKTGGPISPLSVDKVSQMKVTTPGNNTIRSPNHNVDLKPVEIRRNEKTRPSSPPHSHGIVQQSLNMSNMDRSQKELEYQRLLESFNRSLTHVIEVNQQLYSALKNVPTAAVNPPFPQDVLRIRDEMTQTSLALPRIPKVSVAEKVDSAPQSTKVSEATTTTASNYSDDFEHQSQTEAPPPPPEQTPNDTVASSSASSTTTSSSGSSSSSSSANSSARSDTGDSNTKSSQSHTTSSSFNNDRVASPRGVQNRPETNATDDERKATSNTTTAHSSDFDSRSFSLSDSHNNTTNNHPPMPEEYLPSFEESLRRKQLPLDIHEFDGQRKSNQIERNIEPKEVSQESSISEEIQHSQGEEISFSFKHGEHANDLKVNSVPLITSSSDESIMKNDSQTKTNKDTLVYMENADATINSDLLTAMFNRTDLEVSILSTTVSETNLSYSSIGMFDQLIQSERSKENHLVSRVHAKQKALLNRAKGQLAWLELQKQRYREKGMTDQITAVKKKQRAILLRLQKDRSELNRALKSSTESSRTMTANDPVLSSKMVDNRLNSYCSSPVANHSGSLTLRKSSSNIRITRQQHSRTPESPNRRLAGTTTTTTSNSIQIAVRGRELEPNDRLEDILLRREEELRKRKEHVQRLLEWHRKLEREEEELIAVEDRLLAYNTRKLDTANTSCQEITIEERVHRIEKSLRTLQSIPPTVVRKVDDGISITQEHEGRSSSANVKESESEEEIVLTGGSKLNKFWFRLTGIEEQRYEPGRNYPITRLHMETLFEDAKKCVLKRFQGNDGHLKEALLEQSIKIIPRKEVETDANTTESVEDTASLQSTAIGEVTVRTAAQLAEKEVTENETPNDTVTIITDETTNTEQTETVDQEEPDAMSGELPPMEEVDDKCLLSSTVNAWSPGSRKSIESVEFHTLEETPTQYQSIIGNEPDATMEEEPVKSESYSITFEDQSVGDVEAGEESQQLIEDMSLPPLLLNNTSLKIDPEDSASTSSCESSATVELSVPLATEEKILEDIPTQDGNDLDTISSDTSISIAQSLDESSDSSSVSNVTTPTTVTPTMSIETNDNKNVSNTHKIQGDDREDVMKIISPTKSTLITLETSESSYEEEIFHTKSSSASGSAHGTTSELAKRLATLHDELEELSETLERTPLMKSPVTVASFATKSDHFEDQNSSEETITFEYDEDGDGIGSPSGDLTKDVDGKPTNEAAVNQTSPKIEVKLRSKGMGNSDTMAIVAGSNSVYNRDYPVPSQQLYHHQPEGMSTSSSVPNIGVRMPDIINEAEVLRRQQLQIEQEIKELEQQVGFFREIPNKPPPPYIPPANGSPLALLFPSETRIDELIDGRVEELHRDRIAPENLHSDHVTNVYEKLILDMCKELYHDLRPADPTVSFRTIPHDKRPLVFHNPPDALRCMKDYLRVKIRRVLNDAQLALQQQQHQHQQHQLLLHHQLQQQHQQQHPHLPHTQLQHHHLLQHGHCTTTIPFLYGNGCANKRKPDQVDEILKQETHDDDARWTNFDREEIEVKDRITDELLKSLLAEALQDMGEAYERKCENESLIQRQESAM